MTFWTRAAKKKNPKRSAKMIDGTEKPSQNSVKALFTFFSIKKHLIIV